MGAEGGGDRKGSACVERERDCDPTLTRTAEPKRLGGFQNPNSLLISAQNTHQRYSALVFVHDVSISAALVGFTSCLLILPSAGQ